MGPAIPAHQLVMIAVVHNLAVKEYGHVSDRVSYYSKLRFITSTGTENLFIAQIQHFLRVVNGDAQVLRLAICKVFPATYGVPQMRSTQHIMSASLSNKQAHQTLAVDISELDTKLVTAQTNNKLYGIVYGNTSGMS